MIQLWCASLDFLIRSHTFYAKSPLLDVRPNNCNTKENTAEINNAQRRK